MQTKLASQNLNYDVERLPFMALQRQNTKQSDSNYLVCVKCQIYSLRGLSPLPTE